MMKRKSMLLADRMSTYAALFKTVLIRVLAMAVLLAAVFAIPAAAIPSGWTSSTSTMSTPFNIGTGVVTVNSSVYSGYTSGQYVYTYEILHNGQSGVPISFFAVSIASGSSTSLSGVDTGFGTVNPSVWQAVNSGSIDQSVNAMFFSPLVPGQTSSLMWFASNNAPGTGTASLFGSLSGVPYTAVGSVYAPAPEPATVLMLSLGAFGIYRKKLKR